MRVVSVRFRTQNVRYRTFFFKVKKCFIPINQ